VAKTQKTLLSRSADRSDEHAVRRELREQVGVDLFTRCRKDDRVVGRMLGPAEPPGLPALGGPFYLAAQKVVSD